MTLGNLMEEKQLDLNQPFLSVRRYSSNPAPSEAQDQRRKASSSLHKLPALPRYKPELKSGPVSKPRRVPFVWGKIPGNPKKEKELNIVALESCPGAPKPPSPRSTEKFYLKI